jgi:hypothetical protein
VRGSLRGARQAPGALPCSPAPCPAGAGVEGRAQGGSGAPAVVRRLQRLQLLRRRLALGRPELAAAVEAAPGAGHDLQVVVLAAPQLDLAHERLDVAEAVGAGEAQQHLRGRRGAVRGR